MRQNNAKVVETATGRTATLYLHDIGGVQKGIALTTNGSCHHPKKLAQLDWQRALIIGRPLVYFVYEKSINHKTRIAVGARAERIDGRALPLTEHHWITPYWRYNVTGCGYGCYGHPAFQIGLGSTSQYWGRGCRGVPDSPPNDNNTNHY